MRKLTAKQKLAFVLSLYFFGFLALIASIFLIVFRVTLTYQIKREMSLETLEIVNKHLAYDKTNLIFVTDSDGNTIGEELLKKGFSGLFLDKDLNKIRAFGFFNLYDNLDNPNLTQIISTSKNTVQSKKISSKTVMWQSGQLFTYFVPLINNGNIFGVAVLGKSLNEINSTVQIFTLVFSVFGAIGILGSFILGRLLVTRLMNPIKNFSEIIDGIDLDKLDNKVELPGHPSDDLVVLGDKFNSMLARLNEMSVQQKDFISNVSHELKTPLAKAVSTIDVITEQKSATIEDLELIRKDLYELNSLIDKILLLSSLRKSTLKHLEKINIKQAMEENIIKLGVYYKGKEIKIRKYIPDDLTINMPKEYADIVFGNILSNSFKYSHHGATITIDATKDKDIVIKIKDTGIGMNPLELNNVFNRFYRTPDGKRVNVGSGVGLSLVKNICDLYDIEISYISHKNTGTQATLEFKNSQSLE